MCLRKRCSLSPKGEALNRSSVARIGANVGGIVLINNKVLNLVCLGMDRIHFSTNISVITIVRGSWRSEF